MSVTATKARVFGSGIKRREDPRLVTGTARYTEDITLPGMVHAAILRSPHGHARITKLDTSAREKGPRRRRRVHEQRHRRRAQSDPLRVAASEFKLEGRAVPCACEGRRAVRR